MNWIWGEKKGQEKVKLNFEAKNRRHGVVRKVVKVHLELELEYPESIDIAQALKDTKTSFELPMSIEMIDAHLSRVEILDDKTK